MLMRTNVGGYNFNSLIISLNRNGCIRYPLYEVVLMQNNSRSDGKVIESLGFFNPHLATNVFVIDSSSFAFWLNCGVTVHSTVKNHIVKFLV